MSTTKSTASLEVFWNECTSYNSIEAISMFCIRCEAHLPSPFLFKTSFQRSFFPRLISFLNSRPSEEPNFFETLNPLLSLGHHLVQNKKFKHVKSFIDLIEALFGLLSFLMSTPDSFCQNIFSTVSNLVNFSKSSVNLTYFHSKHEEKVESIFHETCLNLKKSENYKKIKVLKENQGFSEFLTGFLAIFCGILQKSKKDWNEGKTFASLFELMTSVELDLSRSFIDSNEKFLIFERFLMILEFINRLTEKQKNFGSKMLSTCGEKFKVLVVDFIHNFEIIGIKAISFKEDSNQLASLFFQIFTFFKYISKSNEKDQTAWNIPLIIFHVVLNQVLFTQSEKNEVLILYILEFIYSFYASVQVIKASISDFSLGNMLFHQQIFSNRFGIVNEIWKNIWNALFEVECKSKSMFDSILSNLRENRSEKYLKMFNDWIREGIKNANVDKTLEYLMKFQMIDGIFMVLQEKMEKNYKVLVVGLLELLTSQKKVEGSGILNSFSFFITNVLNLQPESSEIYQPIIVNYLKMHNIEVFHHWIKSLNTVKNDLIAKTLVESFLLYIEIADDSFLYSRGVDGEVFECLSTFAGDIFDSSFWMFVILSLVRLVNRPSFEYLDSPLHSFLPLLNQLRQKANIREIAEDVKELLKEALFNKDTWIIRFPQLIPLYGEVLMSSVERDFREFEIKRLKTSEINIDLLSKHGFFAVIMKNIQSFHIWKSCETLSLQIISSNFSTSDLSLWVQTFQSSKNSALKASLLETLKSGVNKLSSSEKILKYAYFTLNNKIFLDFFNENYYLPKDFSIIFWVFLDFSEKSSIFSFRHSGETTEIFVAFSSVIVKIQSQEESFEGLLNNSWNFVCINFSMKIQVFINGNLLENNEKKWKPVKPGKLEKCCIGNNCAFNAKNCYLVGKIASLVILKKTVDINFVQNFWIQSQKLWNQDLIENDLVLVDLLDEKNFKKETCQGVYFFRKTPAYHAFKVYGIRRFMHEVHCFIDDDETLQEFFKLIKVLVFINQMDHEYFTKQSINFLVFLMAKARYSEEISEVFISIFELFSESQLKYIQSIINYNTTLKLFLQSSPKFFQFFIQKFIQMNPATKPNLLTLTEILSDSLPDSFSEILTLYLSHQESTTLEESLPSLISLLSDQKNYETLQKVLISLKKIPLTRSMLGILLSIFSNSHPISLQLSVFDLIFLSNPNKPSPEVFHQLLDYIDEFLPSDLSPEFLEYLLTNSFDLNSSQSKFFLRLLTKRLRFFNSLEYQKVIIASFVENKDQVFEVALKHESFPGFLLDVQSCCENSSENNKFVEVLLEIAAEKEGTLQIRTYLDATKDINLFKHLIQKFALTPSVNSVLQSFEVLQEQLAEKPEAISEICENLQGPFIVQLAKKSLENFKVSALRGKIEDLKDFLTNFLNFLVFGLAVFRGFGLRFEFFRRFLENQEIQFFERDESQLKTSQIFFSVYLLIELLKKYLEGCEALKEDLIFFIFQANLQEKLGKFCEKHTNVVKNSLRDVICNQSILEINRETIESKVESKLNLFIYQQQRLKSLIDCYDLENSEIFTDTQVLNEIIQVFEYLFQRFVVKLSEAPFNPEPIIHSTPLSQEDLEKWSKDFKDQSWASDFSEEREKKNLKLFQDCYFFSKSLKNLKKLQTFPRSPPCKVRQKYDKFFRWSTFKASCLKSNNPQKSSSFKSLSEAPVVYINLHETGQSTDGNCDSANFSDNSSRPSRENTYKASKSFKAFSSSVFWVERIQVQGSSLAKLSLSPQFFDLHFEGLVKSPETTGALAFTRLAQQKRRVWQADEFLEVLPKRFLHKHTALEFILNSGKSYYLNFFTTRKRDQALKVLNTWKAATLCFGTSKVLQSLKNDWKQGKITNFEYLMTLNRFASRSLNDISQYPIFPWILSDYRSGLLDFNDKKLFRDLKFPVGAQKLEYQALLQEKIESWKDDFLEPYHHGSHYSNGGIVLHYLVRVEPFSTQAKNLQGGNFDIPDRLFFSMSLAWESCIENMGTDNKELVPELFFNGLILENASGQYLGINSLGVDVSSVKPPNWAVNNWDFIVKHRNLLESEMVSRDLNFWIDLIFGFKQVGKNALASFNVFNSVTYEGLFEDFLERHENIEFNSMIEQVYHFGQTPQVLFEGKAHPAREEGWKNMNLYNFFYFNTGKDLAFKPVEKGFGVNGNLIFFYMGADFVLFVKEVKGFCYLCRILIKNSLEIVSVLPEVQLTCYFPELSSSFHYILNDFSYRAFELSSFNNSFSVVLDKFLIAGLDRSFDIKVFDMKGKLLNSLSFHSQIILTVTSSSDQLFSGSFDCSIKSWHIEKDSFIRSFTFFGHEAPVISLKIIQSFQVLVSLSAEGRVLIHDTKNAECLNSLIFPAFLMDVNENGIVLLASRSKVLVVGINCETVSEFEVENDLESVQISPCANFCIEAYSDEVVLRDIFSLNTERCEKIEGFRFRNVLMHRAELGFMYWAQGGTDAIVGALRYVSLKKLENKNEIILDLI